VNRTHEDIADELLVLRCQDGDAEALKALIARWQPRLMRFAWRLTAEREAASDAVQDAWLAIVRGLRRLDDPARFRTWAYRIVRNRCVDFLRRRAVRRSKPQEPGDQAPRLDEKFLKNADPGGEVDALRAALRMLSDDDRAVLVLRYLDGMGVAEIARVLDVPAGTVKSRLHHARNRLKQVLERVER